MTKLIIGCGYLGQRVGRKWLEAGHDVYAMTRWPERREELEAAGYRAFLGDVMRPLRLPDVDHFDSALHAVGFDRRSGYAINQVYAQGLENVMYHLRGRVGRFIHISSTGVYAQKRGEWVDEDSRCLPTREGGLACLNAEHRLRVHSLASRSVVLRLAGIYGPGRIPKFEALRTGQALSSSPDGYLNLIHVDDAVRAVLAAESRGEPGRYYIISDGTPVLRGEFYREMARLTGSPPPRFAPPDPGSSAGQRGSTHKRVSNQRMRTELQVTPQYPSYREGLAAIFG